MDLDETELTGDQTDTTQTQEAEPKKKKPNNKKVAKDKNKYSGKKAKGAKKGRLKTILVITVAGVAISVVLFGNWPKIVMQFAGDRADNMIEQIENQDIYDSIERTNYGITITNSNGDAIHGNSDLRLFYVMQNASGAYDLIKSHATSPVMENALTGMRLDGVSAGSDGVMPIRDLALIQQMADYGTVSNESTFDGDNNRNYHISIDEATLKLLLNSPACTAAFDYDQLDEYLDSILGSSNKTR